MTSAPSVVRQAIRFENPERIPIWYVNCDQTEGDAIVYHLSLDKQGRPTAARTNGGTTWKSSATARWAIPRSRRCPTGRRPSPAPAAASRSGADGAGTPAYFDLCEDRYRLASLDLSGFTVYTLMRGFENSMTDFLVEPGGSRACWT